jgi:hypothetical protein
VDRQKNWFFKIKNTELRSNLVTPWSELAVVRPHHRYLWGARARTTFEEPVPPLAWRSSPRRCLGGARAAAAWKSPCHHRCLWRARLDAALEESMSLLPWGSPHGRRCCLGGARLSWEAHADAVLMFLGRGLRSLLMLLGRGESVWSWCFGRCLVLVLRKDKNESVALIFFLVLVPLELWL